MKYWDECSFKERLEVAIWEFKRLVNVLCFRLRLINVLTYKQNINKLAVELKEIEERYGQD